MVLWKRLAPFPSFSISLVGWRPQVELFPSCLCFWRSSDDHSSCHRKCPPYLHEKNRENRWKTRVSDMASTPSTLVNIWNASVLLFFPSLMQNLTFTLWSVSSCCDTRHLHEGSYLRVYDTFRQVASSCLRTSKLTLSCAYFTGTCTFS